MSRKVQMLGRSVPLIPLVIGIAFVLGSGVVIGTFFVTRPVPMTMKVTAYWNILLWQPDGVTPLESIALGELCIGDPLTGGLYRYPETGVYILENTGKDDVHIAYSLEGFPEGAILTLRGNRIGSAESILAEDELYGVTNNEGMNEYTWYFTIEVPQDTAEGDFAPMLTWNAGDQNGA